MTNTRIRLRALLGQAFSILSVLLAASSVNAQTWVPANGDVRLGDGTPVCAMVLANGQYIFSCDGTGAFDLGVPLDGHGQIKLFSFADGFAPFSAVLGPNSFPFTVFMETAQPNSPLISMSRDVQCSGTNRVRITGAVESSDGQLLCAMVLANGQHMFSCDASQGRYDLDVPLDANGQVTIFGFADGFQPFRDSFVATSCLGEIDPDGKAYAALGLDRLQLPQGISVTAGGSFWATTPDDFECESDGPDLIRGECSLYIEEFEESRDCGDYALPLELDAGRSLRLARGDGQAADVPRYINEAMNRVGYVVDLENTFYQGQQSYTFSGSGGAHVGAFESRPLTAPPALNILSPVAAEAPYIVYHDASSPLTLSWNGNDGVGEVQAEVYTYDTGDTGFWIICEFTDDGRGEISSDLLLPIRDALRRESSTRSSSSIVMHRVNGQYDETPDLRIHVMISSGSIIEVELQ